MSQHFPQFGSQSAYDDAFPTLPPKEITVPQEVCFQIGVFKGHPGGECRGASTDARRHDEAVPQA